MIQKSTLMLPSDPHKPTIRNLTIEDAWLNLSGDSIDTDHNPLLHRSSDDKEMLGLHEMRLMKAGKYLEWAAKVLCNVELLPFQAAVLEELWMRPFPMMIAARGGSKTWLIALYSLMRCILIPKTKVVIVGAAFRQSKFVFEYMDTIWRNAPVLRSVCDNNSGPSREADRWTMRINDSWAISIPIGTGEKIRGLRATVIACEEFGCQDYNTLVETDQGLVRIGEDDCKDKKIYTGDKSLLWETPAKHIKTPLTDVYEIKLKYGYVIRCSENHKVMTSEGWKTPLELCKGDFVESDNKYKFSKNATITEKEAWLMGILISEGSITDIYRMTITTTDANLRDFIIKQYNFKCKVRPARTDYRGWNCKECYSLYTSNKQMREKLYSYGLDYTNYYDKKIPREILKQPRNVMMAFLEGLFEGGGSCFLFGDKWHDNRMGVAYYSVSEVLCRDVQIVLNKLGYESFITSRKSTLSDNLQWMVRLNGRHAYDFASQLNIERFQQPLNNCYVPSESKYMGWDQSRNKWWVHFKRLNRYIQKRFTNKEEAIEFLNVLQSLPRFRKVLSVKKLVKQEHLYDYYLPVTNSYYADGSRHHNSVPPDIYETVIAGFASVTSTPVENVKIIARRKRLEDLGLLTEEALKLLAPMGGNQSILSGTAGYDFDHFASYWNRYKKIIESRGNKDKLNEVFDGDLPDNFSWKDYSIIRIPYTLIPDGFMDMRNIARSKATMDSSIFGMEYDAIFVKDSNGFFKRTLIESCVAKDVKPIGPDKISFSAVTRGNPDLQYVYGVDPASEKDNFSIVVLELWANHTRVVYCWTTNRRDFRSRVKAGLVKEYDFYSFCARKLRDLMKFFPCAGIGMDAQGGGIAVEESLHDLDKLQEGEQPIWQIIDNDKEKDTDILAGLHILDMVQFARSDWTSEANHGMRKDFEDKVLLFPQFDPVAIALAAEGDARSMQVDDASHIYDSLETCMLEIEELKNELATIVLTRTGTGVNSRDRWDTPETKTATGTKGRLRKDRYSALVIANMLARTMNRARPGFDFGTSGGFAHMVPAGTPGQMYSGPEWFTQGMNEQAVGVVKKQ